MKFPASHPTLLLDELTLKAVSAQDMAELEIIVSYRPEKDRTAQQLLELIDQTFEDKSSINWGVYLQDKLIGTVGFYRGFKDDKGEVGYVTIEKYRRKGYTAKAIQAVLDYGLSVMELKIIDAQTLPDNLPSRALLKKLGFYLTEEKEAPYLIFRLK